jgi:Pin2-interacting protein X1
LHGDSVFNLSSDASKFGSTYLSKFGFDASSGNGVGLSGDGRTTHIKVSQKLDMLGIGGGKGGSGDKDGIAWKQNKDFESLLKRLNDGKEETKGNQTEDEVEEVEESVEDKKERKRKRKEEKEKAKAEKKEKKKRKREEEEEDKAERKEKKKRRKEEKEEKEKKEVKEEKVEERRAIPRHRA